MNLSNPQILELREAARETAKLQGVVPLEGIHVDTKT
jgi:hypothetical protein